MSGSRNEPTPMAAEGDMVWLWESVEDGRTDGLYDVVTMKEGSIQDHNTLNKARYVAKGNGMGQERERVDWR